MQLLAVARPLTILRGSAGDTERGFWHGDLPGGMQTDSIIALLYRRHGPMVFRRARRILGNEGDAHEIVQDVFLSLFENPQQFQGKSSLTTFLYSATTHACLNRLRNQNNRDRLARERFAHDSDETDRRLSPEQILMLHRALEDMPDELAQVAVYYLVDGLTHEEIARILSCSRRHVGNLLARLETWGAAQETA
jgi:RNA polymerase sigma-70 factor (ECF subfamily)